MIISEEEKARIRGLHREHSVIKESELQGKGCANTPTGCITQRNGNWVIMNNKKGGIWRTCKSKSNCQEMLGALWASK